MIEIVCLFLYCMMGIGTVCAMKGGICQDVRLEKKEYLVVILFPIILYVIGLDWIARKIVR